MKIRLAVSAIGLALVLVSMTPLFAHPEDRSPTAVCCGTQGDCASNESCCDAESIGREDCDLERTGYCRTSCARDPHGA